jgi:hypothetical protein
MSGRFSLSSLFGRRQAPEAEAPDALIEATAGQLLEAFLASELVQLHLREESGRLTDLLNREAPVAFDRTDGMTPPAIDDLLVVVPPPQTTDAQRRLHRPGHPVKVVIGPYEVVGQAHVPPGAQPTGFLLRTNPRFVPLTGATIRSTLGTIPDQHVDVAIVNLHAAESFRDLTPEDQV